MADKSCIQNDTPSADWLGIAEDETNPGSSYRDTPDDVFPDIATPARYQDFPNKRRQTTDRFSVRLLQSDLPGSDVAIEYIKEKYLSGLSVHTIRQAGGVILAFQHFLQHNSSTLFSITRKDIGSFVEHEQDRGLSSVSIAGYLRSLYTFLVYLVGRKLLPSSILQKKIRLKLPDILPRAIPQEDLQVLLSATETDRDRALVLILLRTGMRIGELLNVKVSDVILPERKILIYLGEKNYQGRAVYMSEDATQALQDWFTIRNTKKRYLFYGTKYPKMSYGAAYSLMRSCLTRACLLDKNYSLHSLRHTFATDMLNAGLRLEVLQQILGHESIELTMRYARLADVTREDEYFRAMNIIEQGKHYEPYRVNSQLQAVFEEKKLFQAHD